MRKKKTAAEVLDFMQECVDGIDRARPEDSLAYLPSLHVEDARALLGYINELEKENALLGAKKGAGQ